MMINFLLVFLMQLGLLSTLWSQCINFSAWGSGTAPTGGASVTMTTCAFAGDYSTLNAVVAGESYISTSNLVGAYFTVTQGSPAGTIIAFGNAPLSWTATVGGAYYIHLNSNMFCGTDAICHSNEVTHDPSGGGGGGGCSDCSSATAISSLPYNLSASTCGACDNFSFLDACGSSYMDGEDYVFTYTPAVNELVDLTLSGTLSWTGLFISDDCPSSIGANCVASNTNSAGNPSLNNVSLTAGQTYYIIVSTWPSPDCTPFVIDMSNTPVVGSCSNCSNPTVIPSLPFNTTSTTCGACNDFSSLDACASFYMGGEDYVFSYTPPSAQTIDVTLSGTLGWTGVFVTAGCPSSGVCVGSSTNTAGNPVLPNIPLLAGQTYYIIVSTWPLPDCTPFTINVNTVIPTCTDGLQNGGETGVDCGGPCPPCTGPVTASDCSDAVNICSNAALEINPSGYGTTEELLGNFVSNPTTNPNAFPGNAGCLLADERNSTWMIINIASNGTLEFELGDPYAGTINCYDWIMWTYDANTCSNVLNNLQAPIACNWNGTCNSFTGMSDILPAGAYQNNFESAMNVTCGQQYLICFSNYSSALTTVPFIFTGTANISCTFYEPINVNSPTICEGYCATLTADGGITYSWAADPDLSGNNTATVTACPPNAGTFNYSVTGTGACGTGTAIATVSVLANTDPVCNTLLSTKLMEFKAYLNADEAVDLFWRTENESGSNYFLVQRSLDAVYFETIDVVEAAGNSTQMVLYNLKDEVPYEGTSYYRLQLIHHNGQVLHSPIRAIENHDQAGYFRMFPNPTSEEVIIQAESLENIILYIFNPLGQKVEVGQRLDADQLKLDVSHLIPGIYQLHFEQAGSRLVRKLVIQ